MFLWATGFFEILLLFRLCWIRGPLGGGKTLLAVAIADELIKMGLVDGCISNIPTILPPMLGEDDGTLFRRAVIFDEAWTHLDSRQSLVNPSEYGAYARKIETYWLFPSVNQIDKRLRSVIVERDSRWWVPGLGFIWVYRYQVELGYGSDDGSGKFALRAPQSYFNWYDTKFVPSDDGGIASRWRNSLAVMTKGRGVVSPDGLKRYLGELQALGGLPDAEGVL